MKEVYNSLLQHITLQHPTLRGKLKLERSLGFWASDGYAWLMPQAVHLYPTDSAEYATES
jgi:hypothetical protein